MLLQKFRMVVCLSLILSLAISNILISEENDKDKIKVSVIFTGVGPKTLLSETVKQYFNTEIEKKATLSKNSIFKIFLNTTRITRQEADEIVLSVITAMTLPDEVVQLGKENEIFYSVYGKKEKPENLPKEGKFIREYVTEEFLKQFNDIYRHEIYVVKETKLQEKCKEIVDEFFTTFVRLKSKP